MIRLQVIQPEASFRSMLHDSPQAVTAHLLTPLQISRLTDGAAQLPSILSGLSQRAHMSWTQRVVWQHLHNVGGIRAHTTIAPSPAALLIRRCHGLGLGPPSNTLNSTTGTCSQPFHTWCYSFLVAGLLISRKN